MGYWQSLTRFSLSAIAAATVTVSTGMATQAKTPDTAPAALTTLLDQIDAAANEHALDALLNFYGANFAHSDGFDKAQYGELIADFWEDYPRVTYDTELLNWEQDGDHLIAETLTTIKGIQKKEGRWVHLENKVRAEQHFMNGQLIKQDILSESSEITSGENPPAVRVLIPETVAPKEDFGFDVIVNDPLGGEILLGGALEEIITKTTYTDPEDFDLDILPAGGIFKRVEAPESPGDVWYSAIVIRSDGMTLVSRRVKVQES